MKKDYTEKEERKETVYIIKRSKTQARALSERERERERGKKKEPSSSSSSTNERTILFGRRRAKRGTSFKRKLSFVPFIHSFVHPRDKEDRERAHHPIENTNTHQT